MGDAFLDQRDEAAAVHNVLEALALDAQVGGELPQALICSACDRCTLPGLEAHCQQIRTPLC